MTLHRPLLRHEPLIRSSPAERYERDKVPLLFEPLARLFLEQVPVNNGDRVLDLACGTGIVARLVAQLVGSSGRVTGIDNSADMLSVARRNEPSSGAPIGWRLGDASNLPLGDETFDLVLCQQGFQYFADQPAALREMHRVIRPGGRLAICVASSVSGSNQPYQWAKVQALTKIVSPEAGQTARQLAPFFRGNARTLRSLISSAGFSEINVRDISVQVQMGPLHLFVHEDDYPELDFDAQTAVVKHIQQSLQPYVNERGVELPYGMYIAKAIRP